MRNTWAKSLLLYNIQNPVELDANIAGAAVELWKLLTNLYDKTSELALLYAEEQLRSLCFWDGDNFLNYLTLLYTLWQNINTLGENIRDISFHSIILSSLPASWNPIVATLYTTTSSVDI